MKFFKFQQRILSPSFLYFLYVMQGVGLLFPWNTILMNHLYYYSRCKDLAITNSIIPIFGLIFMVVKFIFLICSSLVVHLVSIERQVIVSGIGNTVVFLLLGFITIFETMDQSTLLSLTLILVFFSSLFSAFLNNALFAILGKFSPRYTQAISNGMGFAGVLTSIIKIITIVVAFYSLRGSGNGDSATAISTTEIVVYYLISALVQAVCVGLFILFNENPLADGIIVVGTGNEVDKIALIENAEIEKEKKVNEKDYYDNDSSSTHFKSLLKDYFRVFKQVKIYAIAVFLVFTLTLAVFPSFLVGTKSTHASEGFYYSTLFLFVNMLLYNAGDWIGKTLPMIPFFCRKSSSFILLGTIARVVFIPLYFLNNIDLSFKGQQYPIKCYISSDELFYFINLLLGISNGYFATLAMMFGPTAVTQTKDRPKAGLVMVFFLSLGLTLGVIIAFIFSKTLGL